MTSSNEHVTSSPVEHIVVYIIEGDDPARTELVRHLFSHPVFITYVMKIDLPEDWLQRHAHLSQHDAEELYQYKWCLADAKRRTPNNYVLVIKDTSTTNVNTQNLAEMLTAACQEKTWHLCYLNKWLDRCDLYTDKTSLLGTATLLVKTYSPQGCQAILFSPQGRDIILTECKMKNGQDFSVATSLSSSLNHAISQGYINATCFTPNLISYDLTAARHNNDYYKCQECRQPDHNNGGDNGQNPPSQEQQPVQTTGQSGSLWSNFWVWLLIILLVIGLIWFLCYNRRRVVACDPEC